MKSLINKVAKFLGYEITRAGYASDTRNDEFFARLIRHTDNFGRTTWRGQPIWQNVLDLWTTQETISEVKPSLLIECGTNRGGSALFFADLFDLMGHGRVVTVDIEKMHDLSHPRIKFLVGSSTSTQVADVIRDEASRETGPVMVILDSDHSRAHVAREIELYAPLVTPGSFLLVQDGVIDVLDQFASARPGPLPAIEDFIGRDKRFESDVERNRRFLITHHPKGWFRRLPGS